ncbi:hypothetical protein F0562_012375 [Nyssa sinensis]|uniref:Uncharacterized protein n=1 Tax=Nyssa sinensis TaxID=561372 RepID=A0A5J4ZWC6_9ASTE|nr:hypothetical protein F0562_012375 [Nyssa sinensis]
MACTTLHWLVLGYLVKNGLLVKVVALAPMAHAVSFGHLEVVDFELAKTATGPDQARADGSGLDEAVAGLDHARATSFGLAEVVAGSGLVEA